MTKNMDADVAVIGLGAWGSSALWRLAARGVDAIGIERYDIGHALGSSHGGSRMFRVTCLEHPMLVPLARRSFELWRELESVSGERLFEPTGGLLIGPPDGTIAGGTLRAAREHDIEVEPISRDDFAVRFPQHHDVPGHHIAVLERSAGIIRPEAATRAAVRASGARVFTGTAVSGIELVDGGAEIHTATRVFRVNQVVVTVGCWLRTLVDDLPLETVRMPITWFRPSGARDGFHLDRMPVFMRELDEGGILWGNGWHDDVDIKLGLEDEGHNPPLDPADTDRAVTAEDWLPVSQVLEKAIPGLQPYPSKVAMCMMARTPDGQFIIGRPRRDPRIVIAGGCNAHGYKHAAGIGDGLADLVLGIQSVIPLSITDPDRFSG